MIDRRGSSTMAGKIFLSYRRQDEQGYAHALFARLEQSFSPERVFMDVEGGIAPGQDFVRVLEDKVNACDVMLVLIGPKWLTATDEMGRRRLDNPQDIVRMEIESALRLGKKVIPVLVGKTEMAPPDALPEPLKSLARLNAVELTGRFSAHAQALIKELERTLAEVERPSRRWLIKGLGAAVALAAIGGASWMFLYADESILTFTGHDGFVRSVAFAPDGRTALSGSTDRTIRLWDVASAKQIHRFAGHLGAVTSVAFAPDGHTALSGSVDGTLKLWDVTDRKEIRSFAVGYDISKEIRTPAGRVLRSLTDDSVLSIAFAPDGRTALSGSSNNTVTLWDIATGNLIRSFTGHDGAVTSVAFAPDGRTALSGSYDQTVWLWDIASGSVIRKFIWHTDEVTSVAFAPDGRTALSSSKDGMLKLWNVESGEELRRFTGHPVWSVAFAPDGRTALAGGYSTFAIPRVRSSRMLTLWDIQIGNEIRTFTGHHRAVQSVAFAPDGRRTLSGSSDGTLKLWDLGRLK